MRYIIPKEFKNQAKIWKFIYVSDLLFLLVFFMVMFAFGDFVHPSFQTIYYIWNIGVGILLITPSTQNHGRNRLYSLIFLIVKDRSVYKPISITPKTVCSASEIFIDDNSSGGDYN